jgi:hypothetical protein
MPTNIPVRSRLRPSAYIDVAILAALPLVAWLVAGALASYAETPAAAFDWTFVSP